MVLALTVNMFTQVSRGKGSWNGESKEKDNVSLEDRPAEQSTPRMRLDVYCFKMELLKESARTFELGARYPTQKELSFMEYARTCGIPIFRLSEKWR